MTVARRSRRFAYLTVAATFVLLAFFVLSSSPVLPPALRPASSGPLTATVLFDGVNIVNHDTVGSAIVTNFSGAFSTAFTWTPTGSGGLTVTQAEIQLLFFGTSIATSSGQFLKLGANSYTLSSDFTQNRYIYEGVYEIVATLSNNGTTLYSQGFYVWIQATDHLTIINIVLILLLILEVYEVAALGRMKIPKQPAAAPPSTPTTGAPPSGAPPSTTTPPPATPQGGAPPGGPSSDSSAGGTSDTTPPSGGT